MPKQLFQAILICILLCSCHELDDRRIPSMPVNIDLSNPGLWATYGVHGYGQFNKFILAPNCIEPPGFSYVYGSATGYGGVLLICGQAMSGSIEPLAYDLSCPVERLPEVRVYIDFNTLEAICPDCDSHYDVVEANGAPTSGPAEAMHYALTPYSCYPTNTGGYIITR